VTAFLLSALFFMQDSFPVVAFGVIQLMKSIQSGSATRDGALTSHQPRSGSPAARNNLIKAQTFLRRILDVDN